MRERARETRPDVTLPLDVMRPARRRRRVGRRRSSAASATWRRAPSPTSSGATASPSSRPRAASPAPTAPSGADPAPALPGAASSRSQRPRRAPRAATAGRRMRFGLVHRVMTDALAALGVLAVVSTASLSPWTNVVLARRPRAAPRHPRELAGTPALRHFATIAPARALRRRRARACSPAARRSTWPSSSRRSCRSSASRRGAAPRTTSRSSSWRSCTSSRAPCSAAGSPTGSASSASWSSRPARSC